MQNYDLHCNPFTVKMSRVEDIVLPHNLHYFARFCQENFLYNIYLMYKLFVGQVKKNTDKYNTYFSWYKGVHELQSILAMAKRGRAKVKQKHLFGVLKLWFRNHGFRWQPTREQNYVPLWNKSQRFLKTKGDAFIPCLQRILVGAGGRKRILAKYNGSLNLSLSLSLLL